MLTRHFARFMACAAFLCIPFASLHASGDAANTKPAETKKNVSLEPSPQNPAGENHPARAESQQRRTNRLAQRAGAARKPAGFSLPNPALQRLKSELALSGAQVRQIKALYQPASMPKRGIALPNEKEIASRQRELLRILTPRQKDLLVGRYFDLEMDLSCMPEPRETGLRKYPLGKQKSGARDTVMRDLAEESKILETLQSTE